MTTANNAATTKRFVLVPAVEVVLPPVEPPDGLLALLRIAREIVEVETDVFAPMNRNVLVATSTVLRHLPRILEHRDDIVGMRGFDARHIDNLSDYAKATWLTHVAAQPAPASKGEANIAAEVARLRVRLIVSAIVLAHDGTFDPAAVAKRGDGSCCDDVAMAVVFREQWCEVKGHGPLTAEDLTRGALIAVATFGMIGRREQVRAATEGDAALRARCAWTLLDRAYGEVRRALEHLRHRQDDVDFIAPNLRLNRS
jgi:hypothetical protein